MYIKKALIDKNGLKQRDIKGLLRKPTDKTSVFYFIIFRRDINKLSQKRKKRD